MDSKKLRASEVLPSVQTLINSVNIPDDINGEIKEKLETIQANLLQVLKNEDAESSKKYMKDDNIARTYLPNDLFTNATIPR